MEKAGDIENTGNREHKKPGEAKPIWPRDRRKEKSVRSFPIIIFHSIEYVFCWFYYLFGHVASFRFLLQFSAVMLFAMGVYGVTIDIEKRQIDRGVREATLFAMIARTHALPDGKGAGALKPSVEALARDGVAMEEINLSGANLGGADLSNADFGDTELQGALFDRANIGGARLSQSYDLSNTQIEKACAPSDAPPVLPEHLEWTDRRC